MPQRISIGFHASPPLSLRVSDDELAKLQAALEQGGWVEVDAEDGRVKLTTEHVLWLRVEKDDQRVGFGLGSS